MWLQSTPLTREEHQFSERRTKDEPFTIEDFQQSSEWSVNIPKISGPSTKEPVVGNESLSTQRLDK